MLGSAAHLLACVGQRNVVFLVSPPQPFFFRYSDLCCVFDLHFPLVTLFVWPNPGRALGIAPHSQSVRVRDFWLLHPFLFGVPLSYPKMSLPDGSVSMMDALRALVLKENPSAVGMSDFPSSSASSHFVPISCPEDPSSDEDESETHASPTVKFGSGVLEEQCALSPFEQNLLFKTGSETLHLRSLGFKSPHMAVMLGREEVFWWTVNHDEDLTGRTLAGDTVLHLAAEYGRESLVRGIYERFGSTFAPYDKRVDHKAANEAKRTALHLASAHGHFSIVKYLVDTVKLSLRDRDAEMHTPLMLAAQNGHLEIVKFLHRKRPASLSEGGQYKYTALLLASLQGHIKVVRYIMKNGGSNKEVTNLINTALHVACMGGHIEIVQLLLDKYPEMFNVTTKNSNGQTPLHLAAWAGHAPLARLLVTKYASPTDSVNSKGNTPFLMACLRGHLSVAKTLIAHGSSNFGERNKNRNNALLLAAYGGHNDIIAWIIDPATNSGLSVHDRSTSGNTALLHAASQALLHTVQYLVEHCNANMGDTNNSGRNALELSSGFAPVHEYLNGRKEAAAKASADSTATSPSTSTDASADTASSSAATLAAPST